ncbi:MAG: hypothetical protein OEZ59_13905 [Deltaproteobacteria bacterium]|nr:hypothetical protein [Deltaproteobacteria bacterium]
MPFFLDSLTLPGSDHQVEVVGRLDSDDVAGQTSASADDHGGWKPFMISVRLLIPKDDPDSLSLIREKFHAVDGLTMLPWEYKIEESTCSALGIRKVQFYDQVRISSDDDLLAWRVSFTLKEVLSIPERRENREGGGASAQDADGVGSGDPAASAKELSQAMIDGDLEGMMSAINDLGGTYLFGDDGWIAKVLKKGGGGTG